MYVVGQSLNSVIKVYCNETFPNIPTCHTCGDSRTPVWQLMAVQLSEVTASNRSKGSCLLPTYSVLPYAARDLISLCQLVILLHPMSKALQLRVSNISAPSWLQEVPCEVAYRTLLPAPGIQRPGKDAWGNVSVLKAEGL